jgi:hypothetical protein
VKSIPLSLSNADYRRASEFVIGHLRRLGIAQTSLRPITIIATALYSVALFVVLTAPNFPDDRTRLILKLCVVALIAVPVLFVVCVKRLRLADARALQPLAPSPNETVRITVSAGHVEVRTETMTTQLSWSATSLFVLDQEFAVMLAPRMAPLPITPAACETSDQFISFLRLAQQYKANSAANHLIKDAADF